MDCWIFSPKSIPQSKPLPLTLILSPLLYYITVWIHLGCCNKKNVNWVAYEQRHLFLIVFEAEKSKIKALACSVSGKGLLPGSWTAIFLIDSCLFTVTSHSRRGKIALWSLFKKALIPIRKALPHNLITSQGFHLPVPLPWRLGFQHEFLWGILTLSL